VGILDACIQPLPAHRALDMGRIPQQENPLVPVSLGKPVTQAEVGMPCQILNIKSEACSLKDQLYPIGNAQLCALLNMGNQPKEALGGGGRDHERTLFCWEHMTFPSAQIDIGASIGQCKFDPVGAIIHLDAREFSCPTLTPITAQQPVCFQLLGGARSIGNPGADTVSMLKQFSQFGSPLDPNTE
jgi:hypothetical protein